MRGNPQGREDPGEDLGSGRQTETTGAERGDHPLRVEPQELPRGQRDSDLKGGILQIQGI